jgi:alpha-glucosidase
MYEDDGETFSYQQGVYSTRKLEYQSNRFAISKSEGSYKSPYKTIEIYFHGFHDLKNVQVNQTPHTLKHRDYRFLQPMANYDPVGTQPEGPIIRELPYISIPQTTDEVVLTW